MEPTVVFDIIRDDVSGLFHFLLTLNGDVPLLTGLDTYSLQECLSQIELLKMSDNISNSIGMLGHNGAYYFKININNLVICNSPDYPSKQEVDEAVSMLGYYISKAKIMDVSGCFPKIIRIVSA